MTKQLLQYYCQKLVIVIPMILHHDCNIAEMCLSRDVVHTLEMWCTITKQLMQNYSQWVQKVIQCLQIVL